MFMPFSMETPCFSDCSAISGYHCLLFLLTLSYSIYFLHLLTTLCFYTWVTCSSMLSGHLWSSFTQRSPAFYSAPRFMRPEERAARAWCIDSNSSRSCWCWTRRTARTWGAFLSFTPEKHGKSPFPMGKSDNLVCHFQVRKLQTFTRG